ncbi:grifin [Pongo abelii]|nr:grifin [Pongo abelii]
MGGFESLEGPVIPEEKPGRGPCLDLVVPPPFYIPRLPVPSHSGWEQMAVQFEAFCVGGLAPGWNLLVQGHADSGEDRFETNFLLETGDIAFHIKSQFSSAAVVGNAFQGGRWGPEQVSSIFPLAPGEPLEMEVSSDARHFHVYALEHKVLQFPRRQRPLGAITRVCVLNDHRLVQVELAKRGLSWGDWGY